MNQTKFKLNRSISCNSRIIPLLSLVILTTLICGCEGWRVYPSFLEGAKNNGPVREHLIASVLTSTPTPTSTSVIPPPTPVSCLIDSDPLHENFMSTLCQKLCQTDKISRNGKSAVVILYEAPRLNIPNHDQAILQFNIQLISDSLQKIKISQQLSRIAREMNWESKDVRLGEIKIIFPTNKGERSSVFIAVPPNWKPEEKVFSHTSTLQTEAKPLSKLSCP